MLARMGKVAALSSSTRHRSDGEYNRKRQLRQQTDQQMMARRKARVQAARSSLGSPESDASRLLRHAHQYGHAVSKMNRARIGKPNTIKRINRYPNPEPRRKSEKSLMVFEEGGQRKTGNKSNGSQPNPGPGQGPEDHQDGSVDPSKAGWGVMYRYQAIKLEKEAQQDKVQARIVRNELKAYLDDQVKRKESYFVNKEEERVFWRTKNKRDHKDWKQSTKKIQQEYLAKNLDIKKARQVQLDELNARRMKEKILLKEEDDTMLVRQKREKKRAARDKIKKLKQQEIAIARVKVENEKAQAHKAKLIQDKWAYEAKLDKEYKEILDKQERKRGELVAEIKRKQDGLETIGLEAGATMAEQLAQDAARAKRDQLELRKREDVKAAAVIAKKTRMKNEMIKSIDEAILLKEANRKKRAIEEARFAAKLKRLNDIELDKLDHVDDGREA